MAKHSASIIIAAGLALLFAAVTLFRPLMPVDETRYLSVAWEMMLQGHWVLPTLNFEPYSHKPPILFWLIRSTWEVFGIGINPARLISLGAMIALFFVTRRLAAGLSGFDNTGVRAMLFLAAMPVFLIYGSLIMFDTLLGVFITLAMAVLWRLAHTDNAKLWLVYGAILGIGILTKGPVALVYMLPPALLVRVWNSDIPAGWWKGLCLAVLTGAVIGFTWALPAAIAGGDAYAQKIFVTQSAGRMVNAFDHREPFWFYIPVLIGFLAPLLCIPALWRALKSGPQTPQQKQALRFLLCWILPVIVFFSVINSKQIHYMIPVLPGFAALAALSLQNWRIGSNRVMTWMAAGSFALVIAVHGVLGQTLFPAYDLIPVAQAAQAYKDRPLAAAPKYDGEYGFMMRIKTPIESIGREDIADWFARNPDGVVIVRHKTPKETQGYNVLYTQPFRRAENLSLIALP